AVWKKPVMITENGIPERADRNRAPFIVAHVRQIQRAMDEGVSVIGYMHWSLLDNWELHEHYRPEAQFGLFHVKRDRADPRRCLGICHRAMTEGALAYRHIVEESRRRRASGRPTAAAVASSRRRFGSFTDDGRRVTLPDRTSTRLYEGRTAGGASFTLLLSRTDARPAWLALIYWRTQHIWRRMNIVR